MADETDGHKLMAAIEVPGKVLAAERLAWTDDAAVGEAAVGVGRVASCLDVAPSPPDLRADLDGARPSADGVEFCVLGATALRGQHIGHVVAERDHVGAPTASIAGGVGKTHDARPGREIVYGGGARPSADDDAGPARGVQHGIAESGDGGRAEEPTRDRRDNVGGPQSVSDELPPRLGTNVVDVGGGGSMQALAALGVVVAAPFRGGDLSVGPPIEGPQAADIVGLLEAKMGGGPARSGRKRQTSRTSVTVWTSLGPSSAV